MYGAHTEILVLSRRRSRRVEGRFSTRRTGAFWNVLRDAPSALLRTRVECASHTPSDISSPRAWRRLSAFAHARSRNRHTRSGSRFEEFAQPPADRLLDEPFALPRPIERPSRASARDRARPSGRGRVKTSAARRVHKCRLSIQVSTWSSRRVSWSKQRARGVRQIVRDRPAVEIGANARSRSAKPRRRARSTYAQIRPATIFKSHTGSRHRRRQRSSACFWGKAAKRLPDRGVHARQKARPNAPTATSGRPSPVPPARASRAGAGPAMSRACPQFRRLRRA